MNTNTNFQIVKNTILSNPTHGKKHKKGEIVISFLAYHGSIFRFTVYEDMLDSLVRDILKCPVLSNVELSKPLPQYIIARLTENLKIYANRLISVYVKL